MWLWQCCLVDFLGDLIVSVFIWARGVLSCILAMDPQGNMDLSVLRRWRGVLQIIVEMACSMHCWINGIVNQSGGHGDWQLTTQWQKTRRGRLSCSEKMDVVGPTASNASDCLCCRNSHVLLELFHNCLQAWETAMTTPTTIDQLVPLRSQAQ